MNKPLSVAVEDLKQSLIKTINEANLHIALIKPIIEELKRLVDQEYKKVYEQELSLYLKEVNKPIEQTTVPNEDSSSVKDN